MKRLSLYAALALLALAALSSLVLACPPTVRQITYQQFVPQAAPACSTCDQGNVVPFEAPRPFSYSQPQQTIIERPRTVYVEREAAPVQYVERAPAPPRCVERAPAPIQYVERAPAPVRYVERAPRFIERAPAPVYYLPPARALRVKAPRSFVPAPVFVPAPATDFNAQVIRRGFFGRVRTVVNVQGTTTR
jgi:hypothetical protein